MLDAYEQWARERGCQFVGMAGMGDDPERGEAVSAPRLCGRRAPFPESDLTWRFLPWPPPRSARRDRHCRCLDLCRRCWSPPAWRWPPRSALNYRCQGAQRHAGRNRPTRTTFRCRRPRARLTAGGAVSRAFGVGYHDDRRLAGLCQLLGAISRRNAERLSDAGDCGWRSAARTIAGGVGQRRKVHAGTGARRCGQGHIRWRNTTNRTWKAAPALDHLWIKYYNGTQTAADTFLTGKVSVGRSPYAATRIGTGVCYVIAPPGANRLNCSPAFRTFKFGMSGIPLYDPSKDSTNGGSGAHLYRIRRPGAATATSCRRCKPTTSCAASDTTAPGCMACRTWRRRAAAGGQLECADRQMPRQRDRVEAGPNRPTDPAGRSMSTRSRPTRSRRC